MVGFLKQKRGRPGNANVGEHGAQVNTIKKENLLSPIKFTTSLGSQGRGCSNPAPAPATPSPAQTSSRPPRAGWGTRRSPGWAAGPSALSRRRAAQPRTSGAGSAANEALGGQRTQRVSESGRSPESDSGTLFLLMVNLQNNTNNNLFFPFEPVKQTRAKTSQSLVLAHRPPRPEAACLPAGLTADAPGSYLPPASRQPVQPPRFGAGRPSRTETPNLQPSRAGWDEGRAPNLYAPAPRRGPTAP